MSIVSESTPLLPSASYAPSTPSKETLFMEDTGHRRYAMYDDPTWKVKIQYNPLKMPPSATKSFDSREDMLEHIAANRLEECGITGDFSRFENGTWARLVGTIKRLFCGVIGYQQQLLQQHSTLRHPNYSMKPVRNFSIRVAPKEDLRNSLEVNRSEIHKLWAQSTWANNGPNGLCYIDENGEEVVVHNAVTASNDRTSEKISMMRAIDVYSTPTQVSGESIAYTGRPDTKAKALEQISFMLKRELQKDSSKQKGIAIQDDGVVEFTFLVNNLMSPVSLIGKFAFDELGSIEKEGQIFQALSQETLNINGRQVRIKPLYFNQMLNSSLYYSEIGVGSSQIERNHSGYDSLLALARERSVSSPQLDAAISHLENPEDLLPEEELFYRDLIAKALRIPSVIHCKSSTDRSIIAIAISMTLQQWINTDQPFPEKPHELLQNESFKELFAANVMSGHQVTRVSRTGEGNVKGHEFNSRILGLLWKDNPVALRLMPDRYKKESPEPSLLRSVATKIPILNGYVEPSFQPWFIGTLKTIMQIANVFFSWATDAFSKKISHLERAYPNVQFDVESPYINGRSLFKPKGMIV